jgi:hypothetical protein
MATATVDQPTQKRSSALGIIVFVAAMLAYLTMPLLIVAGASTGFGSVDTGTSGSLAVPLVVFGSIAVIATLAAITRRGRGWAIAALVIAVANNYSPVHAAISDLIRVIFG